MAVTPYLVILLLQREKRESDPVETSLLQGVAQALQALKTATQKMHKRPRTRKGLAGTSGLQKRSRKRREEKKKMVRNDAQWRAGLTAPFILAGVMCVSSVPFAVFFDLFSFFSLFLSRLFPHKICTRIREGRARTDHRLVFSSLFLVPFVNMVFSFPIFRGIPLHWMKNQTKKSRHHSTKYSKQAKAAPPFSDANKEKSPFPLTPRIAESQNTTLGFTQYDKRSLQYEKA